MLIPIADIEPGRRLRGTSADQVDALARSIAEVGLISPIAVYRRPIMRQHVSVDGYGLVAGLHRLEACRRLKLAEIEANVVEIDELDRQIAECDENLCGTKLTPAERAMFTARWKDAYEAKHPEVRHGGDRKSSSQVENLNGSFAEDTAAKTGQGRSTVARDAARGERIGSDVLDQIRGTSLDKGVVLDRLAATPRAQQPAVMLEMTRDRPRSAPVAQPLRGAAAGLTAEQIADRAAVASEPLWPTPDGDQRDQVPRFLGWSRYEWFVAPRELIELVGLVDAWIGWKAEEADMQEQMRDNHAAFLAQTEAIIAEVGERGREIMLSAGGTALIREYAAGTFAKKARKRAT